MNHLRKFKYKAFWIFALVLFVYFIFCLPSTLFRKPCSTILYAANGNLLSAQIAQDGQWRFPMRDTVPTKFKECLLRFEDKHFYHHSGVYAPSILRAIKQNITQQKVVSGASTITMQVVRLSRNNPRRSVLEKCLEMLRAMRLEWRFSKDEILALYAANAPYGGNVVGIDAAAWRYFGRKPEQLSWAESATLAVLPNAPSLIFPGKNQELLLAKRNRVLKLLFDDGLIDSQTFELSCLEPLPQKPYALPQTAQHLLNTLIKKNGKGKRFNTTIDYNLQQLAAERLQIIMPQLEANMVHNAAIMVVEVSTGNVLAYIGNAHDAQNRYSNMVDIIQAPRSTGSILKPFLYAAMLKDGLILPNSLLPDVPIQFDNFAPQNYAETFDGAVPASHALSRSLNVPAVVMLKDYGYARFYHLLQKLNFSTFTKPADHYGLSLILGGAESSLWEITHAYAGMSRALVNYSKYNGKYLENNYAMRHSIVGESAPTNPSFNATPPIDAGSIWCTYKALLDVNRPDTELGWDAYSSATPIAWKTGTSFGNRDAWAVGTTPEYVVGVWVGNADGQGRPELTGVTAAAPILFDVFNLLQHRSWFHAPYDDLVKTTVCHESGMRCGMYCNLADTIYTPLGGSHSASCSFHQLVYTNEFKTHRLNISCAQPHEMVAQNWFVLPAVQEYYYKTRHPEYASLPPFAAGCGASDNSPIGLIYPKSDAKIFIPKNLRQEYEKVVIQATHRDADATLYWHLDNEYLGETRGIHDMEIHPAAGKHTLTLIDASGESLIKVIEIIER
jgi:penicillin-binding protein 1C